MAQNRDRNWQDRDRQQGSSGGSAGRGGSWQGGDDFGQGEQAQHHGFEESQSGSWDEGHETFGSGQQQSGWQGGSAGQQQGGEWGRMGRYGDEGWQGGGGQGRFGPGGHYRMDRDFGRQSPSRGGWGGSAQRYGSGSGASPYVGEQSGWRDQGGWSGYGSSGYGMGSQGSRGGYGSGSYGSGSYGTGYGSGGSGTGWSGYGGPSRQHGGSQQRGFWDRATDEVSSWFGDDQARHRREMDEHRGRGPKGYTRSDERIREDVNDRLTDDGWLDASDVEVQVSSSEVTLTGQVSSRDEKRRAEDLAEQVSGVKHVQNNLRVRERGATSSQSITTGSGADTQGSSVSSSSGRSGASSAGPGSTAGSGSRSST